MYTDKHKAECQWIQNVAVDYEAFKKDAAVEKLQILKDDLYISKQFYTNDYNHDFSV